MDSFLSAGHGRHAAAARRGAFKCIALVLACGFGLAGCAGDDPPAAAATTGILPTDVEPLATDQFGAVLESHRGQVLLVNLWATWCAPCLREIPELVELERTLGPRGLRLIGISLDDPGSEDEIRAFRDEWFPEFRTFYTEEEDWYALIAQIEPNWSSVLPTSFVIDRDGVLVGTLTGGKDYAAFEAAVTPHL